MKTEKRQLNFGIVGCGMIADWYAASLAALSDGTASALPILTGAADREVTRAQTFAEKYAEAHGIRAYESIDALMNSPDIDAVCICTPNGTHAGLALQALRHGKHVLIEKPLALSVEDCDRLIEEAQTRGLCAGVISQRRFSDTVTAVRETILRGHLGPLVGAELSIRYYRAPDYYHGSSWHGTRAVDGGVLMNQGIHGVDILLYLLGGVRSVHAFTANRVHEIDAEDTVCASLRFENGALGTIFATTAAAPGFPQTLTVTGVRGSITLTENEITAWNVPGTAKPEVGGLQAGGFGRAENLALDGHIAQLTDFADAIAEGRKPFVTLKDGRRAVALIRAVYRSADESKKMEVLT